MEILALAVALGGGAGAAVLAKKDSSIPECSIRRSMMEMCSSQ